MEAPKTSLASAVPAALLKKLQSRGGNDRRLTTSLKENKENDDDTSGIRVSKLNFPYMSSCKESLSCRHVTFKGGHLVTHLVVK